MMIRICFKILIFFFLISCGGTQINNDCKERKSKPFLTLVEVIKVGNGRYNHILMLNGCSGSFSPYFKDVIKEYIADTQCKPIAEIEFLSYKENKYKEERINEENDVINTSRLFCLKFDDNDQNLDSVRTVNYVDGVPLFWK